MILQMQMVQLVQQMAKAQKSTHKRTIRPMAEIPELAPHKEDPENLKRFLCQLSNTFSLDKVYFADDKIKIKYASNLLGNSDKFFSLA